MSTLNVIANVIQHLPTKLQYLIWLSRRHEHCRIWLWHHALWHCGKTLLHHGIHLMLLHRRELLSLWYHPKSCRRKRIGTFLIHGGFIKKLTFRISINYNIYASVILRKICEVKGNYFIIISQFSTLRHTC